MMMRRKIILAIVLVCESMLSPSSFAGVETSTREVRLGDVSTIEGVRDNLLIGYGVVVGLHGTGDSQQTVFSVQTLANLMQKMGVQFAASAVVVKNIAGVFVTSTLPPFARPGLHWTLRCPPLVTQKVSTEDCYCLPPCTDPTVKSGLPHKARWKMEAIPQVGAGTLCRSTTPRPHVFLPVASSSETEQWTSAVGRKFPYCCVIPIFKRQWMPPEQLTGSWARARLSLSMAGVLKSASLIQDPKRFQA